MSLRVNFTNSSVWRLWSSASNRPLSACTGVDLIWLSLRHLSETESSGGNAQVTKGTPFLFPCQLNGGFQTVSDPQITEGKRDTAAAERRI